MANTIKKGESLFIPFKNGESVYDSQLKPRMYKTKEQYDRFGYRFKDAEMVEYVEVVRCKDCENSRAIKETDPNAHEYAEDCVWCMAHDVGFGKDDFCSYGERREG